MEEAVIGLETAIKNTESKLDNITWKLESYEKGILSCLKQNNDRKIASVMDLMHNIQEVKNDFAQLRLEVYEMEERNKEVKNNVTEQLNTTYNVFSKLKTKLAEHH